MAALDGGLDKRLGKKESLLLLSCLVFAVHAEFVYSVAAAAILQ